MKNLITLLLIAFCLNGHSQCSLTVTVNSATICAGTSATLTASGTSSYTWTPTASLNTNTGASVIASPTITTIYTVTGTTGTCTASNTTTVVVNPTPIANFFGVDTIGCSPLSTAFTDLSTLSGGTIFSWNWNFGNGQTSNQHYPISQTYTNASATNAAYYTVSLTITSNNGCSNTKTIVNYIEVYPTPIITITPINIVICNGGTGDTLHAHGASTYTWTQAATTIPTTYLNANGDSVIVDPASISPPQVFNYTVTGTDANGCIGTAVASVNVIAIPVPHYSAHPDTICAGQHTTLCVDSMPVTTTYTWTASAGAGLGATSGNCVQATPIYSGVVDSLFNYHVQINLRSCPPFPAHTISVVVNHCPPPYQKMLADSTEFNVTSDYPTARLSNPQQTLSACIHPYAGIWYAKKDSLYKGKTYKKITGSYSYSNTNPNFQGLMREDTVLRKVYFIPNCDTTEALLYNFSLIQGDTISYHFPNASYLTTSGVFTVDSIRLKHDYKSYYHRHFYLRNHGTSNNMLELIEGVGSNYHPLFFYCDFMFNYWGQCGSVRFDEIVTCKWDNGKRVYFDSCVYNNALQSCFYGDSCNYSFGCGGIEQYAGKEQISVYPNPASSSLQVTFSGNMQNTTLQITDMLGNTVKQMPFNTQHLTFNIGDLAEGVYTISITTNEGVVNKRLVIVR